MRPCITCAHPQRLAIDTLLALGTSAAEVARQFELGERAVRRHADAHLPKLLAETGEAVNEARDVDVLAEVKKLHWRTIDILNAADNDKTRLSAIREAKGVLELLGKLLGDIDERPQVNVLIAPEWLALRGMLMTTLAPYPDARQAVAAALLKAENAIVSE